MTEKEELLNNVPGEVDDMTPDYINAIKDLKENSVDKAKYEQLRLENKKLLDAVVNGQTIEQTSEKPKVDIQELREKLFNNENQTNMEYVQNALNLRNALIEQEGIDPFVPHGNKIAATEDDYKAAQRVADGLQAMLDEADGNPDIFNNEYQRNVIDTMPSKRNYR